MDILVIIDVQNDFCHPNGALYVKNGNELPVKIANVIHKFDKVLFTVDWHPTNHCSFIENGGIWPKHCVAYTEGAGLPNIFKPFISDNIIKKGESFDKEEYGAFSNVDSDLKQLFIEANNIVICGIAGDYCVKETILDILKLGIDCSKINVWLDGIVSIDKGMIIENLIHNHNLNIWTNDM